jgi:hypothetical protein
MILTHDHTDFLRTDPHRSLSALQNSLLDAASELSAQTT